MLILNLNVGLTLHLPMHPVVLVHVVQLPSKVQHKHHLIAFQWFNFNIFISVISYQWFHFSDFIWDEVDWPNNVLSKFIFSFECRSFEKRCFCTFFQISVLSKKLNFERTLIDQMNWTIYKLKNIRLIVLSKIYLFVCSKNNLLTFLT